MIYATTEAELDATRLDRGQCEVVPDLEEWTGGDLMITPIQLPLTQTLLPKHIEAGASIVQVKRGHDLASSIVDRRIHVALSRMRSTGARTCQCVLLFVGILQEVDGEAHINRQPAYIGKKSYWSVQSSIDKWTEHGGVYTHLAKKSLLPKWLLKKEQRLIEYMNNPTREIFTPVKVYEVDKDDPLQDVIEINDWRKTLTTIPQLGPGRVATLVKYMDENGAYPSLFQAMIYLTDRELCTAIPGFGEKIWRSARDWIGLDDGMEMTLEVRW